MQLKSVIEKLIATLLILLVCEGLVVIGLCTVYFTEQLFFKPITQTACPNTTTVYIDSFTYTLPTGQPAVFYVCEYLHKDGYLIVQNK